MQHENPYNHIKKEIQIDGKTLSYYSLPDLNDPRTCEYFWDSAGLRKAEAFPNHSS